jgi:4-hydroxy-tetrahydrodipicolinate reductase
MKIALFGHGAMGRLVGARAVEDGHEVGLVVTSGYGECGVNDLRRALEGHDVAVDFSVAEAVLTHVEACALAEVPLVEGTTGWDHSFDKVRGLVRDLDGSVIYGANFSTGANVFFRLVERAADVFAALGEYDPFVEEAHHVRKKDAPSGTAIRLREILEHRLGRGVQITSTRAGHIPGTHRVGFDSSCDDITLTHTARSREGFAAGALLAARWIHGRRGLFAFSDAIDDILSERKIETWPGTSIGYVGALPHS